jgi:serine protease Do
MSDDNINKDEKGYSFIQEQIASKKKSKLKRMLYSVIWTLVLACVFGIVAGVVFCVSGPTISKILGKDQDKKTVEFPTTNPENGGSQTPGTGTVASPGDTATNNQVDKTGTSEPGDSKNSNNTGKADNTKTVVIDNYIQADIDDLQDMYTDLRELSQEVNHSIVNVISVSQGVDWFQNEVEASSATSGLIVANNDAELLILVSYDKIKEAKELQVVLADSKQVKAKLQDYDSDLNLAVIAVSLEDIPDSILDNVKPATLGESYSLTVGAPILGLGSPNGFTNSMEFGMISSIDASAYITDNKIDLFTTDINNYENSDGYIINMQGEVIGIITTKLKDETNQDVNSVIGISKIKNIIQSMVNNKARSYFGIKGMDMPDTALKQADITCGICVTEVEADSPALEAGLQSGDMILAINDSPILSVNTFNSLISALEPKAKIKVTIRRTGNKTTKDMDLEVVIGKKK